jgi:hypothetical protein
MSMHHALIFVVNRFLARRLNVESSLLPLYLTMGRRALIIRPGRSRTNVRHIVS